MTITNIKNLKCNCSFIAQTQFNDGGDPTIAHQKFQNSPFCATLTGEIAHGDLLRLIRASSYRIHE